MLLKKAELYIASEGGHFIWANARKSALGFYTQAGYEVQGEEYDIKNAGAHFFIQNAFFSSKTHFFLQKYSFLLENVFFSSKTHL